MFRQIALQNLQRKNLGFSETDLLFYGMMLSKGIKVKIIGQNYNVIDEINFRAEGRRVTHKTTDAKKC